MKKALSRREFMHLAVLGSAGALAACAPSTPQVVKEVVEVTRIVEVAGTPQVETVIEEREVVVTATPAPEAAPEAITIMGFPRSETVFAQQLTGRNATPSNFNYWAGWRQQDRGMQQIMNEPLWVDDFERGEIIDALAVAPPEYSADFKTMTIQVREGVYWSDGTELTADDVAFTIEFIRATQGASYNASVAAQVESAEATDKQTVVVQLKEPNPRFHYENFCDLWGSLWVMPKHVFEQFMKEGAVDTEAFFAFEYNPPLSNGPYKLHSFDG